MPPLPWSVRCRSYRVNAVLFLHTRRRSGARHAPTRPAISRTASARRVLASIAESLGALAPAAVLGGALGRALRTALPIPQAANPGRHPPSYRRTPVPSTVTPNSYASWCAEGPCGPAAQRAVPRQRSWPRWGGGAEHASPPPGAGTCVSRRSLLRPAAGARRAVAARDAQLCGRRRVV